ncbi:MAG: hypothetical protein WCO52_02510 [bacterium]
MKQESISREEWGHDNSGMDGLLSEQDESSQKNVDFVVRGELEDEWAI